MRVKHIISDYDGFFRSAKNVPAPAKKPQEVAYYLFSSIQHQTLVDQQSLGNFVSFCDQILFNFVSYNPLVLFRNLISRSREKIQEILKMDMNFLGLLSVKCFVVRLL
jgi:hypothetical protein